MNTITPTLTERWESLKAETPGVRIRNAAEQLGVSEVELLATNCGGTVKRLRPEFKAILGRIHELGKVMALTRNQEVVHERKGEYLNGSFGPHASLFVGEDIDLRLFLKAWASAYAVEEESRGKTRRSLQFFAGDGEALHKIYLIPASNVENWYSLVNDFLHEDQSTNQVVIPASPEADELPDEDIDVEGFKAAWLAMKDTHEFFGMLRKYKVARTQGLRMAPDGHAIKVPNSALRSALNKASERELPIMVFVGNRGSIQIHTGPVKKILDYEQWLNVMDPDFNLHVNEPKITQSWIVRKPTEDGMVTSLELFNSDNELIATLFGKRKPGIPELPEWQQLILEIEQE